MKNNLPYNVMANKVNSWDNVPRYNLVVPALATALGGSQLALIAANAIYAVGATLISSALVKALTPKPKQGLLTNIRDAAAPADIVYGQVRKGGVITYLESTGTDNKYLHMFITLAGHEVESIGDIYVNDKVASFSGNNITTATDGTDTDNWQSKIYVQKFTGASGQDIYTTLSGLSAKPSIDASFTGDNTACLYVRLTYDSDVFASGIPTITAVVKGKKVLNTSGVAQTYPASANAALVIRDYLTSYYGLDTPTSTIDDVSFAVAASDCDDDITLDAGGTEKRYTINGVVSAGQSIQQNLDELVAACGGSLFYSQGSFKLVAGVYSSSVKTLTLDDLRSPIQLSTKLSRRDNFNSVYGTFNDAEQDWIEADFPPILSTGVGSFLEEDNGYSNPLDISLPFTTSAATAQRLAKLTLFRSREQMTFSAEFGMEAFDLEVGDTVALTLDRYGWTAKEFEVISWGLKSDGEVGDLRVLLTLRETSSSAFDWSAEEAALTANNTSLPSATSTETVTFGATSVGSEVDTDGTTLPYIKFSWSVTDESNVDYYDFQWKLSTDSNWNSIQTQETYYKLSPALSLVNYDYRIRSVNHLGVRSSFTTAPAVTTVKDDTVPSAPTSVTGEGGYGSAKITWTAPTTNTDTSVLKDLGGYKVYRGTSANPTVQVGNVSGEVFTDTGLDDEQLYYYRVKAYDLSGNDSAYSADGSVTTSTAPVGPAGADGYNSATVSLYQKNTSGSTPPSDPTGTFTYTFSSGALTGGTLNGWSQTAPTLSQGDYLWVIQATAVSNTSTDSIDATEFSGASVVGIGGTDGATGADGADGADGLNSAPVFLYNKNTSSVSAPTAFSGTFTYTFSTKVLSGGTLNGWSQTPPSLSQGEYLWFCQATASSTSTTDSIPTSEFSAAAVLSGAGSDGADGADGTNGTDGARGSGRWNVGVSTLPTTSSGADSEFTSAIGDPVDKDQAWFYTGTESSPTGQSVWIYNLGTDTWTEQTEVIDGSLLVTETMTADKLVANQLLSGHSLKVGNISIDANAKPISGAGMFVVGADDAGATGTTSGDVVFGSADEYVSWDTSRGTLSIKGELINVGESFVNGRDATTYSCTNTTTDFDLVSNALDILGGAGTYGFIMTGAGGSGAVTDNQTTSDVCAATGGGAGGLALFVLDWNGTDTVTCSLGTGGSAITGVGSSSNGNSGGSSVFKVGGSTKVTCGGGSGGSYLFQTYGTANGGAGGTVTWADGNNGNTDFPKLAYSSAGGRGGNCYLTSGAVDSQVSGGGGCHINPHSGISTSNGGDGNTNGQEMASSGGSAWGDGFRAETPSRYAHGPYKGTSGAESTSITPPAETAVVPLFGIGGRSGYGSHQVPTDSSTAGDGGVFGGGGGALGGVPAGADAYGGNGGYGAGGGGAAAETIKESGAGGNGILYLWKIS